MVEILFYLWITSMVGALVLSSSETRSENFGLCFAALPLWAFAVLPLTFLREFIEVL